ncbi:ABC transporter permease subunit [Catenulispora subtropica]|uniref:ABC transporter membrane protein n=1 Tax=Catenulispora subtropica TaxID=450798 RepID=A0ABP5EMD8_9ACTN
MRGIPSIELALTFRRRRNLLILVVLALLPVLVGIAVRVAGIGAGTGTGMLNQVAGNGLFLVFASLALSVPLFLPVAVGAVAADQVAGDAADGTLRTVLAWPVGRSRLLAAKLLAAVVFAVAATFTVALSALAVGAALFPMRDVTLLSGATIPLGAAFGRALLIALVVTCCMAGVAVIGLAISTLTDSPATALAGTVGLIVVAEIAGSVPQLDALQPWLFSEDWLAFADLLRTPMYWGTITHSLGVQAGYAVVGASLAWARFTSRDLAL